MTVKTLSIIGVGAFGEFMLRHLTPFFNVRIFDAYKDTNTIANTYNAQPCNNVKELITGADIVIIAVPIPALQSICDQISPHLTEGQLVIDVASVKVIPTQIMDNTFPKGVDIIGLHPLFGPQSGKHGIEGQNIAIVNVRGNRAKSIETFLSEQLKLNTIICTAEEHDQQMAYVQGLTHMIAKVFVKMDLPDIKQETKTFALLQQMVNTIKDDSDVLFKAIQTDNPFVAETKQKFFTAVKELEEQLESPH